MNRLIRLTTPHVRSPHVAALQRAMKAYGTFKGVVDGEYGPESARAVKQTKYLLGYPKASVDMIAGDKLYGLLTGTIKPTKQMLTVSKSRIPKVGMQGMALKNALKDVGYVEHPRNSNGNKFGVRYKLNFVPWCNIAVSCWYIDAGSKAFILGKRHHYVPYMVADAERHTNYLTLTYDPKPGDIVTYDWNRDRIADHTGLFGGWLDRSRGSFWAAEGNTAVGNDSNGGEVMKRIDRNKSQVRAFIHVLK